VKCSAGPSEDELKAVLQVAKEAAAKAGQLMKDSIGASVQKTKMSSKDLLTEIDPLCQKIVEEHVRATFPDHKFLGEESVAAGSEESAKALQDLIKAEWLWVVDPIDGTTNFVQGLPLSVVSVGVAYKGQPVVGAIMDPYRDELFAARGGGGATLNDTPIHCATEEKLGDAVIAAGSPTIMASINPSLRGIAALMPQCRSVRMFGSAALHLAWIACGRLTGYFEPDLNSWDTAAGAVILKEAGGKLTGLDGSAFELGTRAVLATNGNTHSATLQVLQDAGVLGLDADTPESNA